MNETTTRLTNEYELRRRRRLNKTILGLFLFVAISVFIMKMVDGILIDFGFGVEKLMHNNHALIGTDGDK